MQTQPKYVGIQALRFIAALMVVITHTTYMIGERFHDIGMEGAWREGNAGVDIFFVISGFVMVMSAASLKGHPNASREFMVRRLMRIVPLYWFATTLKLVAVILVPAATLHSAFDPAHVVASYLFLPWRNVDNDIMPLVGVGWTLTFEMFFYVLFALSLFLRRNPLGFVLPILFALAILSPLRSEQGPAWQVYLDPILIEFGLGLVAARMITGGFRVGTKLGLTLILAAFASLFIPPDLYGSQRVIGWGIPAFVIVLCTASIEPFLYRLLPKFVSLLGDSSFALYLFHSFYVPVVGIFLIRFGVANDALAAALSIAGSIALGVVIHKWLELPLGAQLRRLRAPSKQIPVEV